MNRQTRTLVAALLLGPCAVATLSAAPHALLVGATLGEARDFAVDTAYGRGWSVPAVGHASAELEQFIEDDDPQDPSAPRRMIRVTARFSAEPTGTRVQLSAQEIATADAQVWTQDVTDRYAENLGNALRSLVAKWDQRREGVDPRRGPRIAEALGPLPEIAVKDLGTWAYQAERYAESRGCRLSGDGTWVEARGPGWEEHRVACRDGRSMRIHCENGDCTSGP
jgi:hypothetical protein